MKLKFRETFSYGLGAVGKDMVYALVSLFLFIYYEDVLGVDPMFTGTLFMGARLFDAFNDPIMGLIVDRTKTRFGKFRPWIFTGTVVNAFVLVFMFSVPENLTGNGMLFYISAMYVLWGVTYTIMDIPFWSMIPALTNNAHEREKISVVGRVGAGIGFAIITAGGLSLVELLGGDNYRLGYSLLGMLVAVIFVIHLTFMVLNVCEHVVSYESTSPSLKDLFQTLMRNDQAMVVVLAIVIFNSSLYLTQTLAIYFFKYDIGNEKLFGIFATIGGATQILAMSLLPTLRNKFSRNQIFIGAILTTIGGYVLLFILGLLSIRNIALLSISAMIIFAGFGLATVLTTIFLADTVDYGEWKTGQRSESITFSLQTFVVKFASAISAFLAGVALKVIGLDKTAETQSFVTLLGLKLFMIGIPIIGLIASILLFISKYKLNETFIQKVEQDLTLRKEQA